MQLTYLGHSCFIIETKGIRLLTDPFITGNELASGLVDPNEIKCDYILISHAHGDHIGDVELIVRNNPNVTIISNYEIAAYFGEKLGVKWHPMNTGGTFSFDFGVLRNTTAVHSSSFPDGRYGGLAGGFVIQNDDAVLYFAGDTALTMDMQLLPMVLPPLTAAILPIGGNFTMNAAEAVIAAEFIKCRQIIGCHYDTFGWIKIDHAAAQAEFAKDHRTLLLPTINETIEV